MNTPLLSIGLVIFASIVGSIGPILLKKATAKLTRESFTSIPALLKSTLGNIQLVFGLGFYGASFIIYLFALKGADLSVIFPLVSLSYVWVSFLSIRYLNERMTALKWSGVLLIVAGAILVGLGS